jgi:hypothetical protein
MVKHVAMAAPMKGCFSEPATRVLEAVRQEDGGTCGQMKGKLRELRSEGYRGEPKLTRIEVGRITGEKRK